VTSAGSWQRQENSKRPEASRRFAAAAKVSRHLLVPVDKDPCLGGTGPSQETAGNA
jgi:hypothetical protein